MMQFCSRLVLLFVVVGLLGGPALASSPSVSEAATQLLETFRQVNTPAQGKSLTQTQKAANEKVFKQIDASFDLNKLIAQVLAPHKDKITGEQQAAIQREFRELIRLAAYTKAGTAFKQSDYPFTEVSKGANKADIVAMVVAPATGYETEVTLHWQRMGEQWQVYDISLDGDSLMIDYRNQFGRIIAKEGAQGLLTRIRDRRQKLEQEGHERVSL